MTDSKQLIRDHYAFVVNWEEAKTPDEMLEKYTFSDSDTLIVHRVLYEWMIRSIDKNRLNEITHDYATMLSAIRLLDGDVLSAEEDRDGGNVGKTNILRIRANEVGFLDRLIRLGIHLIVMDHLTQKESDRIMGAMLCIGEWRLGLLIMEYLKMLDQMEGNYDHSILRLFQSLLWCADQQDAEVHQYASAALRAILASYDHMPQVIQSVFKDRMGAWVINPVIRQFIPIEPILLERTTIQQWFSTAMIRTLNLHMVANVNASDLRDVLLEAHIQNDQFILAADQMLGLIERGLGMMDEFSFFLHRYMRLATNDAVARVFKHNKFDERIAHLIRNSLDDRSYQIGNQTLQEPAVNQDRNLWISSLLVQHHIT